ncbi:MAG: glycine zipper 2TM domain-containing protein [Asticcacaulis sp.]
MTKLNAKTLMISALTAGALVVMALPGAASAECNRKSDAKTGGAIAGAVIGGVIGSNAAAHGHRDTGTAIGAVAGAVIGSQIAKNNTKCYDDYSYNDGYGNNGYDNRGGVYVQGQVYGPRRSPRRPL